MRAFRRIPRFWRVTAPMVAAILVATFVVTGALQSARADNIVNRDGSATASSIEGPHWSAAAAVDGNLTTRWSSAFSDPQWLRVDLHAETDVAGVSLKWETAYAKAFEIQVSVDGVDWTSVYSTKDGRGGDQLIQVNARVRYVRVYGTVRATQWGYSLWEFKVLQADPNPAVTVATSSAAPTKAPPGDPHASHTMSPPAPSGYVLANPSITGVIASTATPPHRYFHEFQANCSVSHHASDDPIVYFNQPGASHDHTFMGNTTTNAGSTTASLEAGGTLCKVPGDKSGYWMPTLYNGDQPILPRGPQVIYYKTGVRDYTSVRPFPTGLRFVVGSPTATAEQFQGARGYVEGWECGNSYKNVDFPSNCPAGSELNIRYQAPSCWDGVHLDTPDHKSHMAYPIDDVCPADHPVAVPMIEFKMAFPISGDMSRVRLSSGRGFTFHYDFFNAWVPPVLAALVKQCINGGMQCDARGFDQTHPDAGAALNTQYQLP